jgi:DNA replication and repair protein RecF
VQLVELFAVGFRNLSTDRVGWSQHTNVLVGGNGEGKTNLLEAVAVLGNLRSFRSPSLRRVVAHGETEFLLEGCVETESGTIRLSQQVSTGPPVRRTLRISGVDVPVPQYLQIFPVVALTGADRELVSGSPAVRRAFLDRFTFLLEPIFFDELRRYRRTLRQRNAALAAGVGDREMEVWEQHLANAAAAVIRRRNRACRRLGGTFATEYEQLRGPRFPSIEITYRGEAELTTAENGVEVEEYYQKRYNETRARDRRTGFTGEGPHRHDLSLRADGKPVRYTLSSGQAKVVAAALRLASLEQVESHRGEFLPVIIDDIDAELDPAMLTRLVRHLGRERQLFLSSADRGLLHELANGSSRLEIRQGTVIEQVGEQPNE